MMSSKKKDVEIIYSLQWKNKPANGGDKANIIGMYDIPATTLNWEIFKSYLLKNSGTVGDDVKVSYITDSNREFPIESQTDFQIALYAFRRKSRMGDIVNLKLDRISQQSAHKNIPHSNDAETQFSNEVTSLVSNCCSSASPPEWFTSYMAQFKKNFTEEITATVSSIISNMKPHAVSQPTCYHMRKSKPENSKRLRKLPLLTGESSHETKDIIKSLKMEGKLERKLEKLEHKTKKIKDKKLALFSKSSDSEAGPSSSKSHVSGRRNSVLQRDGLEEEISQMGASPVNTQEIVPHMLGGEIYLHQWEVINTGKLPWTKQTLLLFTWGSKALKPLDTIVAVPILKPGEVGTISVRLQVPNYPGQYECYWHFHHKERRFGHWLGCQIIVDQFNLKGNKSVLETSYQFQHESTQKSMKAVADDLYPLDDNVVKQYSNVWQDTASSDSRYPFDIKGPAASEEAVHNYHEDGGAEKRHHEKLVREIEDLKLQDPTDTNCSSDSDNQSIVSLSDSNSSKGFSQGYVVVPMPDCFKVDNLNSAAAEEGLSGDSVKTVVPAVSAPPEVPTIATTSVGAASEEKSKHVDDQEECFDNNNNNEDVDQNNIQTVQKGDDACSSCSHKSSDIVMVTMPESTEKDETDYVYVIVDGQKVPIPKKIIKSEYLQTITCSPKSTPVNLSRFSSANSSVEILNKEELPTPTQQEIPTQQEMPTMIDDASGAPVLMKEEIENTDNLDSAELHSHCSAAGSCFSEANSASEKNARLFVFPQDCPGYEILGYPVDELAQTTEGQGYTWATSETNYAHSTADLEAPSHLLQEPLIPTPSGVAPQSSSENSPFFVSTETRAEPQPLNLSTCVPPQQEAAAQGTAQVAPGSPTPVDNQIPATSTPDPKHGDSPNRDFLTTERAKRPSPNFLRSETLLQGATSAFNTARSVINRMVPQEQPGKWVNGHWVSTNPETPREANLQALAEMGFWNRDLNATLLARYDDDLSRVVAELVQ